MTDHDLVLSRLIPAAPAALDRCRTEPVLISRRFAPAPFTVAEAETDLRPGGATWIAMRGPHGAQFPNAGHDLELVGSS